MSQSVGSQQKRRGRPRSEKARTAILDAATELLLEQGLETVSIDEVAERAGVSKATIYRWWPSKETLALDALYHEWDSARPEPSDTGSLRADLLALLRPWIQRVRARPYGRVVAELVAEAQTDPEFASIYHARFVAPRQEPARALLRRAIDRGELHPDIDVDLALDLVYGPLFHRLLHGHAPLNDRFVRDVVDAVLAGLGVVSTPSASLAALTASADSRAGLQSATSWGLSGNLMEPSDGRLAGW
jgi:AcrR family transcriptional regulator